MCHCALTQLHHPGAILLRQFDMCDDLEDEKEAQRRMPLVEEDDESNLDVTQT